MQPAYCLNCNEVLIEGKPFCNGCGQKAETHRLTLHEILHEAFHAFTHADKGFFYLVRELALKPGIVAQEYLAGKRKKYFNPFSFLVIVTGVLVLISSKAEIYGNALNSSQQQQVDYSQIPANKKERVMGLHRRSLAIRDFVNHHVNIVLFVSTPFYAFLFWLFYRRRKLFYAEHLTAVVFFNSFLMVTTGVVFAPLIYFTRQYNLYSLWLVTMLSFHIIYLAWAYRQFLNLKGVAAYFKTIAFSLLATICWMIFSISIGVLYVIFG